jgi:lipopolysaccharide/colanic/teichoic acid biosynthesis glycosyltransferase
MSSQVARSQSSLVSPNFRARERRFHERVLKRLIDVAGSAALLFLLSPLLLMVAGLLWLSQGRPVLYRRRVVNAGGEFDAYKFRTMCPDAESILATDPRLQRAFTQEFKLKADPRVTPMGAWLRKYSLDELPQLLNVLRGQMSLVGPRMITKPELEKYGPYREFLLGVKPGLTGYWQVRGRQDVSYEERVRLDIHYITHWSLGLDLAILLETPAKVIRGEGAY